MMRVTPYPCHWTWAPLDTPEYFLFKSGFAMKSDCDVGLLQLENVGGILKLAAKFDAWIGTKVNAFTTCNMMQLMTFH